MNTIDSIDMWCYIVLILGFLLAILLATIHTRKALNYWNERGVPNFNPKTPLGDLLSSLLRKENVHVLLKNVYHHFRLQGHRFAGIYFATAPIFIPIDKDLIKRILCTDSEYFNTRGAIIDKENIPLSDNIFSAPYEKWRYIREIFVAELTPLKVKNFYPVVELYAKLLSKKIGDVIGPLEILDYAQRYTIDVATNSFFGLDERTLQTGSTPLVTFIKQMNMVETFDLLKIFWRYGIKNPTNIVLALFCKQEMNDFLSDFAMEMYRARKTTPGQRSDALNGLIRRLDDVDEPFDFNDYKTFTMFMLMASIETSSNAITHLLYQVGVSQDVQKRLREEIFGAIEKNGGTLKDDSISELKYLDRVFWEVTRMHVPAPALNRICVKDYKIPESDVTIEKGTPVFITIFGPHTDPDIFPEPEQFNPDRFLDNKQKQSLLTFGLGPKYCAGKKMGLHLVKCAVVEILMNYEVSVNPRTGDKLEMVMFSKHLVWKYKNTFWLDFKRIGA